MTSKTRSPLKDKPLRLPGQSIEDERQQIVEDAVGQPLLLALFMTMLAGLEWWRYYMRAQPSPLTYTFAAVATALYAGWRIWRAIPVLRALRQGAQGERAVGQFLERLRAQGFDVFHDLVGPGFNVDHVLVGPPGVFTVETKTWSKPIRGPAEIAFDGESITVNGKPPQRDLVVQANAQASWLRTLLTESTGRQIRVRPVVLFPGWFVNASKGAFRDLWVLEPKALPAFMDREAVVLSREDVKLVSFHLSRFVRTS